MLRFLGLLLAFSSLGGFELYASVWDEPIDRNASDWQSRFAAPQTKYGPGHRGLDIALEDGTKISTPSSGVLYFKGLVVDRDVVTIRTIEGYLASFEPACTDLGIGDQVVRGQQIAWHCRPSDTYEYHCKKCVHFSARSVYGYISPEYLMGNLRPSRLQG